MDKNIAVFLKINILGKFNSRIFYKKIDGNIYSGVISNDELKLLKLNDKFELNKILNEQIENDHSFLRSKKYQDIEPIIAYEISIKNGVELSLLDDSLDIVLGYFKSYCTEPDIDSGKATSYANAIKCLCNFLNITVINSDIVENFRNIQNEISNTNSEFYQNFLSFLVNNNQGSYLLNGFVHAALKQFFQFWSESNNDLVEFIEEEKLQNLLDNDDSQVQIKIQHSKPASVQQANYSSKRELNISEEKNNGMIIKDIKYSKFVLKNANYKCQIDSSHETFLTNRNVQYMEGHHLIPCTIINAKLFKLKVNVNIDCVENIVCVCPTCHRAVHFGNWKTKENIIKILFRLQKEKLMGIGINIDENELLNLYRRETEIINE